MASRHGSGARHGAGAFLLSMAGVVLMPCLFTPVASAFGVSGFSNASHGFFVDELPLASTNKVDRTALRRQAEERIASADR